MKKFKSTVFGPLLALACALFAGAALPVHAETTGVGSHAPTTMICIDPVSKTVVDCRGTPSVSYSLLTNASATGSPVAGVLGGSYVWNCVGTFSGATLTLKALGPDGVTYVTVDTMTSASSKGEVIGSNATVEVVVTSGPPSGIYCSLS